MATNGTCGTIAGKSLSLSDYMAALQRTGTPVVPGAPGCCWARYESGAMVRIPTFHRAAVSSREAGQVLWRSPAGVITYIVDPDEDHPPNAWLYCRDREYALDKLPKEAKRDARRALRTLRMEPLDCGTLLEKGLTAYSETRARVGLSDGTVDHFLRRFELFGRNPAHHIVGAWKEDVLVAFMTLILVEDWVVIEGSFSANRYRDLCPNNGLAHYVLERFLAHEGFRLVSYGTSSIQRDPRAGLHFYKTRIGFEAVPVHRAFVVHPLLRPLVNRITLWSMDQALRWRPANRRLLKAIGVMSHLLSKKRNGEAAFT